MIKAFQRKLILRKSVIRKYDPQYQPALTQSFLKLILKYSPDKNKLNNPALNDTF